MYANALKQLSIIYIGLSITHAASMDLCATSSRNFKFSAENASNRLLLRDCPSYPFLGNAVDHIRSLIVNKLELPHLEWQILQATYTDKGLLFEMSSREGVNDILDQFAVKFLYKDCVLKSTAKDFFAMTIR